MSPSLSVGIHFSDPFGVSPLARILFHKPVALTDGRELYLKHSANHDDISTGMSDISSFLGRTNTFTYYQQAVVVILDQFDSVGRDWVCGGGACFEAEGAHAECLAAKATLNILQAVGGGICQRRTSSPRSRSRRTVLQPRGPPGAGS
jgi:hypothetical protein